MLALDSWNMEANLKKCIVFEEVKIKFTTAQDSLHEWISAQEKNIHHK